MELRVTGTEIHRDPMISDDTMSHAERRRHALKAIRSKIPEEYLQLVGEGDGLVIKDWAVHAIQDVRKVMLRDGNYYLIADQESLGAVGIREDDLSGQLYFLDYVDNRGEKISVGLRKFLEEFDGGQVEGRF